MEQTANNRARQYRQRMRAQGFRQINLWVPDTHAPDFAATCRQQSRLAATSDRSEGILDELDAALEDIEGWV